MRWAWTVPVDTAAERLVLMAYGNAHRQASNIAWLGLARLEDETRLDRKTISAARLALSDHERFACFGYLTDTFERRGNTGRVAVFRLNFDRLSPLVSFKEDRDAIRNLIRNRSKRRADCACGQIG